MRALRRDEELPRRVEPWAQPRPRVTAPRRVLSVALWSALGVAVLTLSLLLHLATPLGRAAVRDGFAMLLTSRLRGTVHVGEVSRLDFGGMEMLDFSVTSPDGELVITTDRLSGELAFLESLRRGTVVLTPCDMEGGELRLTRGPTDQIDLIYAMEVPDDRFMIPLELRDIRLLHQTIVVDLPGGPGRVQMANVYGLADLTIGHEFAWRMDQTRGHLNIPIVDIGFERLNGRLRSDDATPLLMRMVLDLEVADPSMEMRYRAPGAIGGEGGAGAGITLGVDVPDEQHIGTPREEGSDDTEG